MSRLYFHSPSGEAELLGSEYAWLRHLANGPATAAWNLTGVNDYERAVEILTMVPEAPDGRYGANYLHTYLREAQQEDQHNKTIYGAWKPGTPMPYGTSHDLQNRLVAALRTALSVNGLDIAVAGVTLRTANLDLNTALVAGSDPVRLAAKLSGWSESHCWFDGPHRAWLADIIDEGLRVGLYRRGLWYADQPDGPKDKWSPQGWEEVTEFLRARDDEPVVTSYSAGDSFPGPEIAEWRDDQWYDLPDEEKWELAMAGLKQRRPWAQIAPDNLATTTFHYPVTIYDLFAPDRDDRVRVAVATVDGEPVAA